MRKTLPISAKNCSTVFEHFIQSGVRPKRKSTATVNLKTGHFNANSAVIISSVSKEVKEPQNLKKSTALLALLTIVPS